MINSEKEQGPKARWDRKKKRGRFYNLALNVLAFLGYYAVVRIVHIICFRVGMLRSPGSTSWDDVFFWAILPGIVFAELQWSDLKRKFKDPPPGEDWTTK